MDLIDRFGRAPLGMAAYQLVVLVISLGYGLWPPSLGSHIVLPGLVMATTFGIAIWLTLTRPWDPTFSFEGRRHLAGRRWHLWDPGLIVGITLYLGDLHRGMFESAKDTVLGFPRGEILTVEDALTHVLHAREAEEWAADTWGALILSGPNVIIAFILPAAMLGILWLFLPH